MKSTILSLLSIILLSVCNAQPTDSCYRDAVYLLEVLQKTPSYKDQVKGKAKAQYLSYAASVLEASKTIHGKFECFCTISKLLFPIRDNHLYFYEIPQPELNSSRFSDSSFVKAYRSSGSFTRFPNTNFNLDSLENALKNKPKDSTEGIYYYDKYLTAGLFKTSNPDSLVAVILATQLPTWEPGQVAFILMRKSGTDYNAYHANIVQKTFGLFKNERYISGSLNASAWKKSPNDPTFYSIGKDAPLFELKNLRDDIQYLRLGNFSAYPRNIAITNRFYDSIKTLLTTPHLIVDLRNNGGGAFKTSKKFLVLLRKYTRNGNIYALINRSTFSNAEQFMIELQKSTHVTSLGEKTNGTLTYGSNTDRRMPMPSGRYSLYITDMRDNNHYLPYEEKGVEPDIELDQEKQWLQQVLELIEKKS